MTDNDTIARAKNDIHLLNCKLAALRNEEQRCQQQRLQLETERSRIQAFVEMCEFAQRYGGPIAALPDDSTAQPSSVRVVGPFDPNKLNGAKPVVVAVSDGQLPRRKLKPDDTPPLTQMIVRALEDGISHGHAGLRPRAMADFVRRQWWPDATNTMIGTAAWRMAREGRLARNGGVYSLNGHG